MARVLQYLFFPLFSRFFITFIIIPDPVFICNGCPGFFYSFVNRNIFPVIDVAGADTAFYRLIRAAAEQGNRSRSLQREHSLVFKEYDSFCRRSSRQSSVFFFACGRLLLQAAAVCPFFHHSYLFIRHHFSVMV